MRVGQLLTWVDMSLKAGVPYCTDGEFAYFSGFSRNKKVCRSVGDGGVGFDPRYDHDDDDDGSITSNGGQRMLRRGTCFLIVSSQRAGTSMDYGVLEIRVR